MNRLLLLFPVAAAACSNAGSDLGFPPLAQRVINAQVFLDRDGSGVFSPADTLYVGARVSLRPPGGGQAVRTATTNLQGIARFEDIPIGEYSATVDLASIGDSLQVAAINPSHPQLRFADTEIGFSIRLNYLEVSIRQARQQPAGKRLLIRGLVLAGVQSFHDTSSYVADTSGQIRLTRVSLRGGLTGNNPGDSVTVLGTVSSRAGQPTLDQAIITLVGTRPAPIAFSLSTALAAGASGGTLDAALVQITGALISDTATVAPDFRVIGSDGSGPVSVILDGLGGYNRAAFLPGRAMTVRGVLVPDGTGKWQLKPRNPGDTAVF